MRELILHITKHNVAMRWLIAVVALTALAHLICMVAVPTIHSGLDWTYVQGVWDRWQTFNTGMIALYTAAFSWMLLGYERIQDNNRTLRALRPALVGVLSNLSSQHQEIAKFLIAMKEKVTPDNEISMAQLYKELETHSAPASEVIDQDLFINIIKHAPHQVDLLEALTRLTLRNQILASRLKEIEENQDNPSHVTTWPQLLRQLVYMAVTQAYIDQLYDFARFCNKYRSENTEYEDDPLSRDLVINGLSKWDSLIGFGLTQYLPEVEREIQLGLTLSTNQPHI